MWRAKIHTHYSFFEDPMLKNFIRLEYNKNMSVTFDTLEVAGSG